jgi:hypothetical protein
LPVDSHSFSYLQHSRQLVTYESSDRILEERHLLPLYVDCRVGVAALENLFHYT